MSEYTVGQLRETLQGVRDDVPVRLKVDGYNHSGVFQEMYAPAEEVELHHRIPHDSPHSVVMVVVLGGRDD